MTVELITSTEPPEVQERAVQQAAEIFLQYALIRAGLPKVLAGLIDAGREKEALAAVHAWGKGTKSVDAIWRELAEVNEPEATG